MSVSHTSADNINSVPNASQIAAGWIKISQWLRSLQLLWFDEGLFGAGSLISFQPPLSTLQPNECQSESGGDNALGLQAFHYSLVLTVHHQSLRSCLWLSICLSTNLLFPGACEIFIGAHVPSLKCYWLFFSPLLLCVKYVFPENKYFVLE